MGLGTIKAEGPGKLAECSFVSGRPGEKPLRAVIGPLGAQKSKACVRERFEFSPEAGSVAGCP